MSWEDWVGRTSSSEDVLEPVQANRMAVTLDRDPAFVEGDPLPPAWHWLYFHEIVRASRLGDEGHPELGISMPPVPLPRRMWAAGTLRFDAPLPLGSRVRRDSTIASIAPKQGSTGPLYFVTVQHVFSTSGEVALREEQTIVYREMSTTPGLPEAQPAPTNPDATTAWHLDSTTLFRYSALTFNGHKIHYDADYSRNIEGYPNIVVHGPLLATLLADLAARNNRPMREFRYRARNPIFLPQPFSVNASYTGTETDLWAQNATGGLAMEAHAS